VGISLATAAALVVLLQFIPFPHHFRAPGVIEARSWSQVVNEAPGTLAELLVPPGTPVEAGQPLARFVNPELELAMAAAQATKRETEARLLQAMRLETANLKPLRSLLESVEKRIARLESDRAELTVRSRIGGVWVAPAIEEGVGRWLAKGTPLGLVVDPASFEFVATVLQEDVDRLFTQGIRGAEIRLHGQADAVVAASNLRKIPAEKRNLPSPALGWAGGGEVPVSSQDPDGQRAAEPFFEVHADMLAHPAVALVHGRAGKIRFDLPAEPLMPRIVRRFQQLLQKRYQI
jgi:putative peptide zinc metalloprotease protein